MSSGTDLSIKEKMVVNKRKCIQMQRKTLRKLSGLAPFEVLTAVLLQ